MSNTYKCLPTCLAIVLSGMLLALPASGQQSDYDLSWYTIDSGGEMYSAGGAYELSGTIGQPDAGEMLGNNYKLLGGFWH